MILDYLPQLGSTPVIRPVLWPSRPDHWFQIDFPSTTVPSSRTTVKTRVTPHYSYTPSGKCRSRKCRYNLFVVLVLGSSVESHLSSWVITTETWVRNLTTQCSLRIQMKMIKVRLYKGCHNTVKCEGSHTSKVDEVVEWFWTIVVQKIFQSTKSPLHDHGATSKLNVNWTSTVIYGKGYVWPTNLREKTFHGQIQKTGKI